MASPLQLASERAGAESAIQRLRAELDHRCAELGHLQDRVEVCRSEYARQVGTFHALVRCKERMSFLQHATGFRLAPKLDTSYLNAKIKGNTVRNIIQDSTDFRFGTLADFPVHMTC